MKIVGYFHGIDPATQGDYYTDVIHLLPEKPALNLEKPEDRFKWHPFLVGMMRLKHRDPNEIIDLQIQMFNRFPPMRVEIDSTREDFLSHALIRKYGESTIIPVKFLNSGQSNTKFHLKQIGYSYIDAGYQWPDDIKIEKTQPRNAKLLRILKKEMLHEQVSYTDTGSITFSHPSGKHNDLVHGWELSLDAVMKFQEKNLGYALRRVENPQWMTKLEETYKDYPTEEYVEDDIFGQSLSYSDRMYEKLYDD